MAPRFIATKARIIIGEWYFCGAAVIMRPRAAATLEERARVIVMSRHHRMAAGFNNRLLLLNAGEPAPP